MSYLCRNDINTLAFILNGTTAHSMMGSDFEMELSKRGKITTVGISSMKSEQREAKQRYLIVHFHQRLCYEKRKEAFPITLTPAN